MKDTVQKWLFRVTLVLILWSLWIFGSPYLSGELITKPASYVSEFVAQKWHDSWNYIKSLFPEKKAVVAEKPKEKIWQLTWERDYDPKNSDPEIMRMSFPIKILKLTDDEFNFDVYYKEMGINEVAHYFGKRKVAFGTDYGYCGYWFQTFPKKVGEWRLVQTNENHWDGHHSDKMNRNLRFKTWLEIVE